MQKRIPNQTFYPTTTAMNNFPPGTRVFFWTSEGEVQYATVRSSDRLPDGTQILNLQLEDWPSKKQSLYRRLV
ncbi:hypothetical protein CPB84DRAFT_284102 [Gymnopilus junonius]|uniref:Uncharacterized protein n=1 Tax=Gymnopilus junonius TaxID=109634 RepID=A0A9P5NF77_GYMJU|nr:hypothetical protein CPB84DRAFT_284102 [Gymnopilus junonius]